MILPTKHLGLSRSILGMGAALLENLREPQTVSSLWGAVRSRSEVVTFQRFTLALDFLYLIGAVEWDDGMLRRKQP
jgi:hypothetical protein